MAGPNGPRTPASSQASNRCQGWSIWRWCSRKSRWRASSVGITSPASTSSLGIRSGVRHGRAGGCQDCKVEIHPFCADHLDGVLALCLAEGWPSLPDDPARALRILTAPGVTTVVAVIEGEVIGFAELFSDGEIQAFLTNLAVSIRFRGRGIGRALVEESLRVAGGERIDLLSEEASVGFYESFPHFRLPGIRLYPFHQGGQD